VARNDLLYNAEKCYTLSFQRCENGCDTNEATNAPVTDVPIILLYQQCSLTATLSQRMA